MNLCLKLYLSNTANFNYFRCYFDGLLINCEFRYIESKPKYWNPKHSVMAKQIDQVDKLKLCLCVTHTINHQNYGERSTRISELLLELKKMFEIHGIKYHLLPQEIHLTQMNIGNGRVLFQS